jgi:hypothetical protein
MDTFEEEEGRSLWWQKWHKLAQFLSLKTIFK